MRFDLTKLASGGRRGEAALGGGQRSAAGLRLMGARGAPGLRWAVARGGGLSRRLRHGAQSPAALRSLEVTLPDYVAKRSVLLTARARAMRVEPSPPEALLWAALVSRKLDGVAFRRQVTLAGYICDFVAASHKLIVEVDGAHHARQRAADARRDRKLGRLGYRVLRIPASVVMGELPVAVGLVRGALGRG